MQIWTTISKPNGVRRYYLDGRRIKRALFVAIKADHYFDCLITTDTAKYTRHKASLRPIAGYHYH